MPGPVKKAPVKHKRVINFEFDRETKNTARFAEVDTEHVKTLYLNKAIYGEMGSPQTLKVTIEAGTAEEE